MSLKLPHEFHPELTDDRLRLIAHRLLRVRSEALEDRSSPYDDNYTRGTTVFGRQRQMLKQLALSGHYSWMTLAHSGMDLTFRIGQVPVRFFNDEAESPQKRGFFKRNAADQLFPVSSKQPVMWRFIVEPAVREDDEDQVYFIGYNAFQEKVSEWMHDASVPVLYPVGDDTPEPVYLPEAKVDLQDPAESSASDDESVADQ